MKEVIKEKLIPAVFGGIAIFLVSYFLRLTTSNIILFASLGSSAVILSELPDTVYAKLKVVIISYFAAAVIGFGFSFMENVQIAAALAIFFTISFILLTNNVHPPAGGVTLAFVFHSANTRELVYLWLSIIMLLIILKSLIYFYKKELHIEKFHHEFK